SYQHCGLWNLGPRLRGDDGPCYWPFAHPSHDEPGTRAGHMTLRTDHIAGGAFVVFGLLVLALSGDLPFGTLSFPGAGMMPKLVAGAMIFFGLVLVLRAGESAPLARISRGDLWHAARVTAITAAAIALYRTLGFIVTMALMLFALIFGTERRHPL